MLDDLPARTEVTLHVEMSPAETAFYEALRQRAVEDLEALATGAPGSGRFEILAHLTRLRRACCNPALVHPPTAPPSSKLAVFGETLAELLAGRHKVLVFSQFVAHLKLIEAYLMKAGIGYQYLDGATSLTARRERIAAFQAGQGDVFLISLTAGGVGLNLTAADYVIHMDPWWNPAVEDQASDRAHRIGQTRPVTIYRLVTKGHHRGADCRSASPQARSRRAPAGGGRRTCAARPRGIAGAVAPTARLIGGADCSTPAQLPPRCGRPVVGTGGAHRYTGAREVEMAHERPPPAAAVGRRAGAVRVWRSQAAGSDPATPGRRLRGRQPGAGRV